MRRRSLPRTTDIACAHGQGCLERARFEYTSQREASELYRNYDGKWKCLRHSRLENWLTPTNLTREATLEVEQKSYGRFWKEISNGYAHGPGFDAYASEFPPGTKLIVTARIELPPGSAESNSEVKETK